MNYLKRIITELSRVLKCKVKRKSGLSKADLVVRHRYLPSKYSTSLSSDVQVSPYQVTYKTALTK